MARRVGPFGIVSASLLLAACGGDETGAPGMGPIVGVTPTPTPTPTSTPTPSPTPSPSPTPPPAQTTIPPRTQTTAYLAGFTPAQNRDLLGFQISVFNIETGTTLPGGARQIDSSIALSERGPRSSDGEQFTGSVSFTVSNLRASYVDRSNNTAPFLGEAPAFVSRSDAVEWTANSLSQPSGNSRLVWARVTPFLGVVPQYYSWILLESSAPGQVVRRMFYAGSLTDDNDLPPSGLDVQRARMTLQSDEPGDGSYEVAGEADLLIDYTTGIVTGSFDLQPVAGSRAQPLTVTLSGEIDRAQRWVRADITGGGTGRFAGAMFGPYAAEIAGGVRFERQNGQSFYGGLEGHRR